MEDWSEFTVKYNDVTGRLEIENGVQILEVDIDESMHLARTIKEIFLEVKTKEVKESWNNSGVF